MPTLEKITISDYRNIEMQEICFSPNVNCIWGDNGEGKTNLLDAIYYLSMTKSAMSPGDRYNFRHGCSRFAICGQFRMPNGLSKRISVEVDADGKKIRHDEKICRTLDHIGQLPVVMVSPSDISLVSESSEERRKFLNGVLSQLDRSYLESLQQYNRLLAQRNRLLKEERIDGALLKVLDERMAACAAPVYRARKEFAARLAGQRKSASHMPRSWTTERLTRYSAGGWTGTWPSISRLPAYRGTSSYSIWTGIRYGAAVPRGSRNPSSWR